MRKTLKAKGGYMLTNGDSFAKIVDLAEGSNGGNWQEITEAEYEKILAEREKENI